ncbi:MAG: hypothetical protein DRH12_19390 [Deltaproteobacteria bacterium]|nr:MAG: hypothetical protein DRG83_15175 [Deltaproteobacteria bacterium]RLB32548.1 MAG: hypothetical protein DRH12_19390 [Deltaproteobacteria bacterium]
MVKRVGVSLLMALLGVGMLALGAIAQEETKPIVIYFFPGGNPGGTYAVRVYNGAVEAAKILGDRVEMHYLWSDWDPQKMVVQFQQALAANPDGIAIMGHPGDEALKPFVDEAEARGIIVTTLDTSLPQLEREYKARGFGFVGEPQYDAGYKLAKEAIRLAGLKEGDKVLEYGILREPTRGQLSRGAIDALEEAGLEVEHLEISPAADADPTEAIPVVAGYLQKHPDIKLLLITHQNITCATQPILEAAGLGPDDIFVAGFGPTLTQLDAIRAGYLDLVLDKQPFVQGFLAVFQIYLTKAYGIAGLRISTGSGFITKDNVEMIAPLVEKGYR